MKIPLEIQSQYWKEMCFMIIIHSKHTEHMMSLYICNHEIRQTHNLTYPLKGLFCIKNRKCKLLAELLPVQNSNQ